MNNIQLVPLVFFQGNCKEAMTFYQGILGGTLALKTYSQEMGDKAPEGWGDKILHAELASGSARINALDSKMANPEARKVELEIIGTDEAKLREMFDKLCEGGKAKSLIGAQADGGHWGRLFDKYGLDWKVTVEKNAK